jgi:hypothetical protein
VKKLIILIVLLVFTLLVFNFKSLISEFVTYYTVHDSSRTYLQNKNMPDNSLMVQNISDPLGQEAKVEGSTPLIKNNDSISKEKTLNMVKHIQLTLLLSNDYNGKVNGVLDSLTIKAIIAYQKKNDIATDNSNYLDDSTLDSLGVLIK